MLWLFLMLLLKLLVQYFELNYCLFLAFLGGNENSSELRKELATLRLRVEALEVELKSKEEDLKRLTSGKQPAEERCKVSDF